MQMNILAPNQNLNGAIEAKNIDVFVAAVPPVDSAKGPVENLGPAVHRATFSNRSNDQALSLSEIRDFLYSLTGGWPKVAAGRLCAQRMDAATGRMKPLYIEDTADLMSWIDQFAKVVWFDGAGYYTKTEFLTNLAQNGEQFCWATDLFHWPSLPKVLYLNIHPEPKNTGRLDELVSMLSPHTDSDRLLLKAFAVTPFWGGPTRKRPLFIFSTANAESDPSAGRGSGKSSVVQIFGRISGGCFTLYRESELNRVLSDLLSPDGMNIRMLLLDNVKALKFSSEFIESLITMDEIGGHMLYLGHGRRPNYITPALTANEPMLSTDLATRGIPTLLNQSKKSSDWDKKLEKMLDDPLLMKELYADIAWHLQKPAKDIAEDDSERWALWWKDVVSRICTDNDELYRAREEVKRRRQGVDADLSSRELVDEILRSVMVTSGLSDPDAVAVFFPTIVLQRMLVDILGRNCTLSEAGQRVRAMKPLNLYYRKNGPDGSPRGYWWLGEKCDISAERNIGFRFETDPKNAIGFRKEIVLNVTAVRNAFHEARGKAEARV